MPTNYERAFANRPNVYAAWAQLNGVIKASMDARRYELVTLAAARRLRSSYCSLAHGSVLLNRFGEPVEAIAQNHRAAGLDPILQKLRDLELSEEDIMDVVLAAAARCFFSKTLDALGIQPDASYRELDPQLRKVLVISRPIADE